MRRILYEDQDTEWVNLSRESERVVVDDGILNITDSFKTHLGIPLDGVRDAVSDFTVRVVRCVVLCCAVLCCVVLCCAALRCAVLCCTGQVHIPPFFAALPLPPYVLPLHPLCCRCRVCAGDLHAVPQTRKYREVESPSKPRFRVAKPWIPPWEKEEERLEREAQEKKEKLEVRSCSCSTHSLVVT